MRTASASFFLAAFALLSPRRVGAFCVAASPAESKGTSPDVCAIDSRAIVSDACASFSTLDSLNNELQPTIKSLTQDSDFFSYYRLNLYNKVCPFWSDEGGMCGNIACAVNTIDNEEDIPSIWRAEELGKLEGRKAQHPDRKAQLERPANPLMGELGENVGESCVVEYDDECDERDYCVPEDESATAKGDYVSLVDNPERFTGYSGPSANQVWEAIYRENCFSKVLPTASKSSSSERDRLSSLSPPQGKAVQALRNVINQDPELDDVCLEKRVFHRIISGMHASISTHLCFDYLNQTTGSWGPNLQCYADRLHDHPERISNLYFNYALVLRALAKVRPALAAYTFCSGDPAQDALTKRKVLGLADQIAAGPHIYDESLMFQNDAALKEDFRSRFRNVSRTMDCVGCDKCRLWGKVQIAGYGTALKILFEFDEAAGARGNPPLRRTELVALVNTLDKLSSSITALEAFRDLFGETLLTQPLLSRAEEALYADDLKEPPTVSDAFYEEFDLVWRAVKWVLGSWVRLPLKSLRIVMFELNRGWRYFLGLPVSPRSWSIQYPARDEI